MFYSEPTHAVNLFAARPHAAACHDTTYIDPESAVPSAEAF